MLNVINVVVGDAGAVDTVIPGLGVYPDGL